jgi:hypothetical protein
VYPLFGSVFSPQISLGATFFMVRAIIYLLGAKF